MKRPFALTLALAAGLAACGDSAPEHTTGGTTGTSGGTTGGSSSGSTTDGTTNYTGPHVLYQGRFAADDAGVADTYDCAWSGSTIETRFTGTSVSIGLATASNSNMYFHVSVDNAPPSTLRLSRGVTRYTVLSPDPRTAHTVRWTKVSEAAYGSVTVSAPQASADGALTATAARTGAFIEFVGDSITAGYGTLGANPCTGSVDNEDADKAYPALVAKSLGVGYTQLGFSGKGVYYNADCTTTNVIEDLYDYTIPPQTENANAVAWSPGDTAPRLIVLNAGTNDFGAAANAQAACNTVVSNNGMPVRASFQAAYTSLLQKIAGQYAGIDILVVYGPMLTADQMAEAKVNLEAVLSSIDPASINNAGLHLVAVGPQGTARACDSHPNADTHAQVAQSLVTAIKALPAWQQVTGT
jgi:lysophospholipase L1-like esterase